MKNLLLTTLCLILIQLTTFGQSSIKAKIIDEKKQAIPYASILLRKSADSTLVKGFISDEQGILNAQHLPEGLFTLKIQSTGYQARVIKMDEIKSNSQIDLGTIQLDPSSTELANVEIKATKPFIENLVDKTVVNVENSVMAAGNSAMEVIEKSPGVIVDKDGNISIRGKQGAKVMIDGKISYLTGSDLNNYLRNLGADQIAQLEIISNPSAKYDAAGTAGILNIKLKKNTQMGMNGSVNATLGQGFYTRGRVGFNLNYRKSNWNWFSNGSYVHQPNMNTIDITRQFAKQGEVWNSNSFYNYIAQNAQLKAGVDWTYSPKTTLGLLVSGGRSQTNLYHGINRTTQRNLNNQLLSQLDTYNTLDNPFSNLATNFNYKHSYDSTGKELTIDLDYARFHDRGTSVYLTQWFGATNNPIKSDSLIRTQSLSNIDQYSFKSDYVLPVNKTTKWGMGLKSSLVSTDNDVQFTSRTKENPSYSFLDGLSNRFQYNEQIHAAYINQDKKLGKWSYQLGLRGEWTIAQGKSISYKSNVPDSSFKRSYFQIFPSAFLQFEANKKHNLGLKYSRRIDRPQYSSMNPFIFYIDNYNYEVGNPNLLPQLTNSFEFTHTYAGAYTTSLAYSHTDQVITQLLKQDTEKRVTYQTTDNLAQRVTYSLGFSLPIPIKSWWTSNTDIYLNHVELTGKLDQTSINPVGNMLYLNSNHTFSLKHDIKIEVGGQYFTGGLEQAFNFQSGGALNLGIQKTIMNKKGTLRLNASDILYTQIPNATIKYADLDVFVKSRGETRVVRLNFSYRFGNTSIKAARERSTGLESEKGRVKNTN
ncbi:TonB-dependent receptor [Aquirufa nivalisilvae]|uniref:outer membrane beta-barrel family protein n=1 Tax=Aquirufa nivalisilvae TaxID=2516557 RepID=UPI0022A8FB0C|nr:outer membrane beta-barrel family protein [Aquirufa nivalisilvae]MCZ2483238.1 TonB-dependent receptor [Aquirufa nivalisilvae]